MGYKSRLIFQFYLVITAPGILWHFSAKTVDHMRNETVNDVVTRVSLLTET